MPLDLLYGYRVDGVFAPEKGHRFNPRVVLLDPYSKAISGGHQWGVADVPYGKDSGQLTRRSRVVLDDFDWEGDHPLATPMSATVIYELHVRGFTQHPSSGVQPSRHLPRPVREDPALEVAGRDGRAADAGHGIRRAGLPQPASGHGRTAAELLGL